MMTSAPALTVTDPHSERTLVRRLQDHLIAVGPEIYGLEGFWLRTDDSRFIYRTRSRGFTHNGDRALFIIKNIAGDGPVEFDFTDRFEDLLALALMSGFKITIKEVLAP